MGTSGCLMRAGFALYSSRAMASQMQTGACGSDPTAFWTGRMVLVNPEGPTAGPRAQSHPQGGPVLPRQGCRLMRDTPSKLEGGQKSGFYVKGPICLSVCLSIYHDSSELQCLNIQNRPNEERLGGDAFRICSKWEVNAWSVPAINRCPGSIRRSAYSPRIPVLSGWRWKINFVIRLL